LPYPGGAPTPTFSSLVLVVLGLIGLGCVAVWLVRRAVRWLKFEKLATPPLAA